MLWLDTDLFSLLAIIFQCAHPFSLGSAEIQRQGIQKWICTEVLFKACYKRLLTGLSILETYQNTLSSGIRKCCACIHGMIIHLTSNCRQFWYRIHLLPSSSSVRLFKSVLEGYHWIRNAGWLLLSREETWFPPYTGVTFSSCANKSRMHIQSLSSAFVLNSSIFASSDLQWLPESTNSHLIYCNTNLDI